MLGMVGTKHSGWRSGAREMALLTFGLLASPHDDAQPELGGFCKFLPLCYMFSGSGGR